MILEFQNKDIEIPDDVWEKHCKMHPVRSEQALYHNLYVTCDNIELITAQEIINVIESEYEMSKHLPQLIEVARKQYESIKH